MSEALLKNTFQKISPAYELVADVTVSVATTQVDFSGLNFGKDDDLLLVSNFVNATGGSVQYKLFVNGNTTPSNYYRQICYADGTTVGAGRANNNEVANANASNNSLSETKIKLTNSGYFVTQTDETRNYKTSAVSLMNQYVTSTFTLTSITSLNVLSDTANGISIGSRFQLYRLKAKKVADIIVSSPTTQVDITSLNLDKDSEYMLVSDVVCAVNNYIDLSIYPNGNNTPTNYYTQRLVANTTSVSSSRANRNIGVYFESLKNSFAISKIKLTNSGYFITQSDIIYLQNGTTPSLYKAYVTSTGTHTSITTLSLISSVANAIGSGSRFTLYRMR